MLIIVFVFSVVIRLLKLFVVFAALWLIVSCCIVCHFGVGEYGLRLLRLSVTILCLVCIRCGMR